MTLNHSKGTSFGQHVKTRYEKAIQMLCEVQHEGIEPIFWSTTAKRLKKEEKESSNPLEEGSTLHSKGVPSLPSRVFKNFKRKMKK